MTAKTKSKYWAVTRNGDVMFEGTFSKCWENLVTRFAKMTVAELVQYEIKITRIK